MEVYSLVSISRGLAAIVDKKFEPIIRSYRWFAQVSPGPMCYAVADVGGRRISMQRVVLGLERSGEIDFGIKGVTFANKLTLDCRIENLVYGKGRQVSARNRKKKRGSASGFKGVRVKQNDNGGTIYRVEIAIEDQRIYLGAFSDEKVAGLTYDAAARILFQEEAHLNFPREKIPTELIEPVMDRIERALRKR